jgi:hypothetical protein
MPGLPVVFTEDDYRLVAEVVNVVRRADANLLNRLSGRLRGPQGGYLPPAVQLVQVWTTSGSPTSGDVLEANSDNLFAGRIKRWIDATAETRDDCWIKFVDWFDADSGDCYALHGKFHLAHFAGTAASGGTSKPLYVAEVGNFECWCKADSAIAKGASGTVSLYNDDFTDSTLNRASTLAKFMDVDTTQWCMLTRTMGTYIVQPVECPA